MSYPTYQYKIKLSSMLKNDYAVPKGSKLISEIIFDNSAEHLSNPDPLVPVSIGPSIMNDENFLPRIFTKEF